MNKLFTTVAALALILLYVSCTDVPGNTDTAVHDSTEPETAASDTTLAGGYFAQGEQFLEAAQYDSALVYFEKSSELYKAEENWEGFIRCYNKIGESSWRRGSYDQAMDYLNRALELGQDLWGEEHPELARSYHTIGIIHYLKGHFERALSFYEKALAIRLTAFSAQHPDVAESYYRIGLIHSRNNQYDEALSYYEKVLTIRLAIFGDNHPKVAHIYDNLGILYRHMGDLEQASFFYDKAFSIRLAVLGENHLDVAKSYNNIGVILYLKGDYNRVLPLFTKALSIQLAVLGDHHPAAAGSYNNIGVVYWNKGDYDRALDFFNKAQSIYLKSLGEQNPSVAVSYENIGGAHQSAGNYDQALSAYNKELAIRLALHGHNHTSIADTYHEMGNVYRLLGNLEEALHFLQKSLAIYHATPDGQHLRTASVYFDLGKVYREKGLYDEALNAYNKALKARLASLGEHHPELAQDYNEIGTIYMLTGRYEEALSYHQRALHCVAPGFAEFSPYVNPPLADIQSDMRLVETLWKKSEALVKRYEVQPDHRIRDLEAAHATHQLAAELFDRMRTGLKSEDSKLILSGANMVSGVFNQAITTANLLYRRTGNDGYLHEGFRFAEQSKTVILRDALIDTQAKRFAGIPDSLLEQERHIRIDLAFYDLQLTQEQLKREHADSAKITLWQGKTFDLRQRYDMLLTRFEQQYPDYYNLKYKTQTTLIEDLRDGLLDSTTALIEYVLGKDSLFIFTLTEQTFDLTAVARDSLLEQRIETLRAGIGTSPEAEDYNMYTQHAYQLYQTLLQPVEDHLTHVSRLILIPDGALLEVPFEGLLTEGMDTLQQQSYRQLPYLINDYAVSYGYSATLLHQQHNRTARNAPQRDYLAYAPVFPDGVVTSARHSDYYWANTDTTGMARAGNGFLPHSRREVTSVLEFFQQSYGFFERLLGGRSRVYLEADATEIRVKSNQLQQYRFVHFATHAFVNESAPELSGLMLAEADTTAAEDGILHLGEVYNLPLNAELVALSACETGLGRLARGEGLIGLTRGFLYAGAESVLMSLHRVNDEATSELMVAFYRALLDGHQKVEALRMAKQEMITRPSARPRDWAWFVLVGT